MNILILGGNGYLGSKLVCSLANENQHDLVCTRMGNSDISMLQTLVDENKLRIIPATSEAVQTAMKYQSFDLVINMVCSYGGRGTLYDDVLEANLHFPLQVLNISAANNVQRFLTIGTSLPDSLNMYSYSKAEFAKFGQYYVENHNLDFYNILPEMFYGSDEPRNRFLPSLIEKMLAGDEVNVTIGTQQRDIIAAQDVIKALLMVVHSNLKGYHEIPVGTGIAPKMSEIVDYIWEQTGRKSKINKGAVPMRKNEPNCVADTHTMRLLGKWEPRDWKTGILQMIQEIAGGLSK